MTKVYSIQDIAIETGLSYHTVYYYLREGLIRESTIIGNGHRIFTDTELEKLKKIVKLRRDGYSIKNIKEKEILAES